jgi:hypothetical protein
MLIFSVIFFPYLVVQARSALALFSLSVSTSPALESDLEPLHSLQRFQLRTVVSDSVLFHILRLAHMGVPRLLGRSSDVPRVPNTSQ